MNIQNFLISKPKDRIDGRSFTGGYYGSARS
jgi:hypothetical protein